jgi:hypothetical protein
MTVVNMYAPHFGAANFIKQILLYIKKQIGPDTIILYDFNIPLSSIDKILQTKKYQQRNFRVNCTIDQIDIYYSYSNQW